MRLDVIGIDTYAKARTGRYFDDAVVAGKRFGFAFDGDGGAVGIPSGKQLELVIFAGIGAKLMLDGHPVISTSTYSAVVIMVIVTTLVTPPALKVSMLRGEKKQIKSTEKEKD